MSFRKGLGLAELIQSGILLTLLGIAFEIGQAKQRIESELADHDRRIVKVESLFERIFN